MLKTAIRLSLLRACALPFLTGLASCGGGGSDTPSSPGAPSPDVPRAVPPAAAPGQFLILQTQRYALYKYDLDSDSLTLLASEVPARRSASEPVLSPDGKWVAYTANAEEENRFDVFVAAVDGSGVTRLSADLPPQSTVLELAWSPDSSRIAYRALADSVGIYVVDRDGTDHRRIGPDASDPQLPEVPTDIRWSPDGHYVAYEVHLPDNSFTGIGIDVHDVRIGGSKRTRIAPLAEPPSAGIYEFAWAPDGSRIAYVARLDETLDLYTVRPDATQNVKVSGPLAGNGRVASFGWSPDGSLIAYAADQDISGIEELYTVAPDGSAGAIKINEPLSAADGNVRVQFARWAPDGSKIAYTAYDGERVEFFTVRPDGTDRIQIDYPASSISEFVSIFEWAPDGSRIAYRVGRSTVNEAFTVRPDGTDNRKAEGALPNDPSPPDCGHGCTPPSTAPFLWSPDGSYLAYVAGEDAARIELFTMRADTGERVRINNALAAGISLRYAAYAWSADGSRIAYAADEDGDGRGDIHVAAPNGAVNTKITASLPSDASVIHFSWSP